MQSQPMVTLNDGRTMPQLGFGVWRLSDAEAAKVIHTATAIGYRSVDTAAFYKNEAGVGRGVRECGIDRKDMFVTTKLWNSRHGYDETLRAFAESLSRLGLDYVDLYLIHWPVAGSLKYVDTWKAFIRLREEGRVKSIGVSNFLPSHLERIVGETGVKPVLDQIECHPRFQQGGLRAYLRENGIAPESWSPLGKGASVGIPELASLAEKYGKTPAQVIIRWHIDNGCLVIPKSADPGRLKENFSVFDFKLAPADMEVMASLDRGARMDEDPDAFTGAGID